MAKSAAPGSCATWWVRVWGEGLPEMITGGWLEVLSRRELGLSVKKLFLDCALDLYPLRLLRQAFELGLSICVIIN